MTIKPVFHTQFVYAVQSTDVYYVLQDNIVAKSVLLAGVWVQTLFTKFGFSCGDALNVKKPGLFTKDVQV